VAGLVTDMGLSLSEDAGCRARSENLGWMRRNLVADRARKLKSKAEPCLLAYSVLVVISKIRFRLPGWR